MARCGKTTKQRCIRQSAELPECEDCNLVKRQYQNWKMIDKKPHKKCAMCGEWKHTDDFYQRDVKGVKNTYRYVDYICKECRKQYQTELNRKKRAKV